MNNTFLTCACLFSGFTLLGQADAAVVPAGPQLSIYGGASYSSGVPGSSTTIPVNGIAYEVDTHVGNTSDAAFTPGIGIAYDFLTTGRLNNFIHDFSVGIDWFYFNRPLRKLY